MKKARRSRPQPPPPRNLPDPASPPSLYELDAFTLADVERWRKQSERFDELHQELHHGLEAQRVRQRTPLLEALRSNATAPLELTGWHRLIEYQYCLTPLSAYGSTIRYGGRFNIGAEIASGAFSSFPALYLAEDLGTAFREFYQIDTASVVRGLSQEELALKRPGSFLSAEIHGHLDLVFDMGNVAALRAFSALIATFAIPPAVPRLARELRLPNRPLIRSATQLQRTALAKNWRAWPVQFDVPANSQVLGRLLCDAGFEAILYPSAKNGRRCLAVFPTNLRNSASFVALTGSYPHQVKVSRLDATSASACI
jgi:hypothetical protein